ncbi:MAG: hypothetical protein IPL61_39050 [Myxococcales bacterium]|nr:hypothetical protein [Myxococcales bacterium]
MAGTGRVLVQTPLPLGEFSAPRPDLAVTTATPHWDGGRHRTLLVIEVAGASPTRTAGPRFLYAHALIDEY